MPAKRNYLLLYAKGLAMGAADVVPGVSGGTIAFISGIYEELVNSIRSVNVGAVRCLFREGSGAFWNRINGTFLAVLAAGIVTSVFTLARGVSVALDQYPLLLWSFFFGLIAASIFYVVRQQQHWRPREWLGLGGGTAVAVLTALSPPLVLEPTAPTVFFAGMLAICAMILPGISGSFILLLIGMYPVLIDALTGFDLARLGLFGAGAAVGLMAFANVLSWLLDHHHSTTLSVLTGFLAGSLLTVWPWKIGGGTSVAPELLLPGTYADRVADPRMLECLAALVAGLLLVLALEYLGAKGRSASGRSI